MSRSRGVSLEECPPRWATKRNPNRPNRMAEMGVLARILGYELMPWQELVLSVITEVGEDGNPFYRQALITVPRQSGKSEVVLGLMLLDRLLFWKRDRQQVLWNAQNLKDGVMVFQTKLWPRLEDSELRREFGLDFRKSLAKADLESTKTRSLCTISGSSASSGHGATLGLVIMDEVWEAKDNTREIALLPTMRTIPDAQFILASTAGDEQSLYLREKVEKARADLDAGLGRRFAYFEWSVPEEDDWEDPKVWARALPAFGWTVDEETLAEEKADSTEGAFRRNTLNQWVDSTIEPVIPWAWVDRASSGSGEQVGEVVWAADASPLQDHTVVLSAAANGTVMLEREWGNIHSVEDFLVENRGKYSAVAGLERGPIHEELRRAEDRGVNVVWYNNEKLGQASGGLYDAFAHDRLLLAGMPSSLRHAMAAAIRREGPAGSWVWGKHKDARDVSLAPLMALSLAVHCLDEESRRIPVSVLSLDDLEKSLLDSEGTADKELAAEEQAWAAIYEGGTSV